VSMHHPRLAVRQSTYPGRPVGTFPCGRTQHAPPALVSLPSGGGEGEPPPGSATHSHESCEYLDSPTRGARCWPLLDRLSLVSARASHTHARIHAVARFAWLASLARKASLVPGSMMCRALGESPSESDERPLLATHAHEKGHHGGASNDGHDSAHHF